MCSAETPRSYLVRPFPKTFLKKRVLGGEQDWKVREGPERSCPQPGQGPVPLHSTGKERRCTNHQRRGQAVGREIQSTAGAAARENEADESKRINNATHGVSVVATGRACSLRQPLQRTSCQGLPETSTASPLSLSKRGVKKGLLHLGLFILGGQSKHRKQLSIS